MVLEETIDFEALRLSQEFLESAESLRAFRAKAKDCFEKLERGYMLLKHKKKRLKRTFFFHATREGDFAWKKKSEAKKQVRKIKLHDIFEIEIVPGKECEAIVRTEEREVIIEANSVEDMGVFSTVLRTVVVACLVAQSVLFAEETATAAPSATVAKEPPRRAVPVSQPVEQKRKKMAAPPSARGALRQRPKPRVRVEEEEQEEKEELPEVEEKEDSSSDEEMPTDTDKLKALIDQLKLGQ